MSNPNERRLGSSSDNTPVNFYYQPKPPAAPHPKVKVIAKGQEFKGTFLRTFVDGEYQSHMLATEEGKITIKGSTSLNAKLAGLVANTKIRLVYLGRGQKKAGRQAAYLWDAFAIDETYVDADSDSDTAKPAPAPKAKKSAKVTAAPVVEQEEDADDESDAADTEIPW